MIARISEGGRRWLALSVADVKTLGIQNTKRIIKAAQEKLWNKVPIFR